MLSVAPMMDVTDRHFRWIFRRLSRNVVLYTEMVVARAILHGDRPRLLGFHPDEGPLVLQLGGDDPAELATAARIAEDFGYHEINLNCGCPSPRVQSGAFGVVLMLRPERVADCVAAMRQAVQIPVSVKCRIGLDEVDAYEDLRNFVDVVAPAGPARFTVHARKAWTKGLSPKQNRTVPPLRHPEVHQLKRDRPGLTIETNGGIVTLEEAAMHLEHVDGVMIGRAARDDPYLFAEVDARFFGGGPPVSREDVARAVEPYLAWAAAHVPGFKLHHATRHLLALYAGQPGTRAWKRVLTERRDLGPAVIEAALSAVAEAQGRSRSSVSARYTASPTKATHPSNA